MLDVHYFCREEDQNRCRFMFLPLTAAQLRKSDKYWNAWNFQVLATNEQEADSKARDVCVWEGEMQAKFTTGKIKVYTKPKGIIAILA